jgi:hypothetical protein
LQRDFETRLAVLREQLQQAQAASALEESVRQAELHITGDLLQLKCPRCTTAFYDFEGCFALQCGTCDTWFCGWCITDCGKSPAAHAHVSNRVNGNVYGTQELFRQAQTERMQLLIVAYISTLPADVQVALTSKVNMHLRGLGIHV